MEKIPETNIENINPSKLEWGPHSEYYGTWIVAQEKINELNKNLEKGEKPWRLPTKDELLAEFNKTGSKPAGFDGNLYWSSTDVDGVLDAVYHVNMTNGKVSEQNKDDIIGHFRCVR